MARSNEPVHWPRARVPPYPAVVRLFRLASCVIVWILCAVPDSRADSPERWPGPFGGETYRFPRFLIASVHGQMDSKIANLYAIKIWGTNWTFLALKKTRYDALNH